jgi:hypothetical protein
MKPLILTDRPIPEFIRSDFADLAVDFHFRFVWGPLPAPDELANYLGARTSGHGPGRHWSDFAFRWERSENRRRRDVGLAEFCEQYETVELWFDIDPNAQLQLIWLLDYFRSYPKIVARLKLRLVYREMIGLEGFGKWRPPAVDVTEQELATASTAWLAYRAATPEGCFDLLIAAAQAGLDRSAERAAVQFDGAGRHGNADARADRAGILANERAFPSPRPAPDAHLQ